MLGELRELWSFRELLFSMVQREIRVRYKNSVLGFFWSFINPLATTVVLTVVFGKLLNNGVENYSAYILAAYLPYMFIQSCVLDASQSVLSSIQLVKKIYFPREILPLATIISNFIHLMLGFVVFFLLLIVNYIIRPGSFPIQATTIYLPILLVISFMLATGLGLIVCALNTFYEDVKYMMGVFMYMLLFLCPVMYFIEEVANAGPVKAHPIYFKLYNLNPVAVLTTAYRKILLAPQYIRMRDGSKAHPFPLEWSWVGYAAVLSFLVLIGGYAVFNRVKWKFVERP